MKTVLKVICLLFGLSTTAWAFMPAGGLWAVDEENTGQAGRGFQIEVENEIMVLTYYGYRADGSSVFYLAAGPIVGNSFSGALTEYQNGKALGTTGQPASAVGSAGTVYATFTSGQHGTITFPGESPKAISKLAFGYANGPEGLMGTYLLTYIGSITEFTEYYTLDTNIGVSTTNGNGIVTNSSGSFACEYAVSGTLKGSVLCGEIPGTSYSDVYLFKISGDRGTGVGYWTDALYEYPLHVLRTHTKNGKDTGLNNGKITDVVIYSTEPSNSRMSALDSSMTEKLSLSDEAKANEAPNDRGPLLSADEQAALDIWTDEARSLLSNRSNIR